MPNGIEAVIIGGGIVDIPLSPVTPAVFEAGSTSLEAIALQPGGDALNESVILSRLGHRAALVTKLGRDVPGDYLLRALADEGVDTGLTVREAGLDTGVNVVLVTPDGERRFITNRNGSLRRLALEDILPALDSPQIRTAKIACLASLFVSPMLTLDDAGALFGRLKASGLILCADTTRPKNGETVRDLAPLLPFIDYFFPNHSEAQALTGEADPAAIADAFLGLGLRHLALKLGGGGCYLAGEGVRTVVPAWPGANCMDTTGAGDAFAAGFIAGLLEGRDFVDCARLANAVASVSVEAVGATAGLRDRAEAQRRFGIMKGR